MGPCRQEKLVHVREESFWGWKRLEGVKRTFDKRVDSELRRTELIVVGSRSNLMDGRTEKHRKLNSFIRSPELFLSQMNSEIYIYNIYIWAITIFPPLFSHMIEEFKNGNLKIQFEKTFPHQCIQRKKYFFSGIKKHSILFIPCNVKLRGNTFIMLLCEDESKVMLAMPNLC